MKFKMALPGNRADTDTDPDKFSVYYDSDDPDENVLIKEKSRGTLTVSSGAWGEVTHDLGYVPLVFVYGDLAGEQQALVMGENFDNNFYIDVSTTKLRIRNNYLTEKSFKYFILYDRMVNPGLVTKSMRYRVVGEPIDPNPRIALAKPGINGLLSENPNDFILHTNYNTFKIIDEGTVDIEVPGLTTPASDFSVPHNNDPTKAKRPFILAFMREEGEAQVVFQNNEADSPSQSLTFENVRVDYENMIFRLSNSSLSAKVAHIRYIILEMPL